MTGKADRLMGLALAGEQDSRAVCRGWMVVSTYSSRPVWDAEKMHYLCYQRESVNVPDVGPFPHWQIYVEFGQRIRSRQVTELLGYPVVKRGEATGLNEAGHPNKCVPLTRFGPAESAARYCSSSWYCRVCHAGDSPFSPAPCADGCVARREKGRVAEPVQHGELRARVSGVERQSTIIRMAKEGAGMRDIMDIMPEYVAQAGRFIQTALQVYAPVRRFAPKVYWLYGASGSHKSRLANAVEVGAYTKPPDTRWFDGYDGQSVCIMNDIRKTTFTFSYLLDLLDRYPMQVEVKNGYRQFVSRVVIFTSAKSHAELWAEVTGRENERLFQLTRRITKEVQFPISMEEKMSLLREMRLAAASQQQDTDDLYGSWRRGEPVPYMPPAAAPERDLADDSLLALLPLVVEAPAESDAETLVMGGGAPMLIEDMSDAQPRCRRLICFMRTRVHSCAGSIRVQCCFERPYRRS